LYKIIPELTVCLNTASAVKNIESAFNISAILTNNIALYKTNSTFQNNSSALENFNSALEKKEVLHIKPTVLFQNNNSAMEILIVL
jgi:hypothetical protein